MGIERENIMKGKEKPFSHELLSLYYICHGSSTKKKKNCLPHIITPLGKI